MTDEEVLSHLSQLWSTLGADATKLEVEKLKEQTKDVLCTYEQTGELK